MTSAGKRTARRKHAFLTWVAFIAFRALRWMETPF